MFSNEYLPLVITIALCSVWVLSSWMFGHYQREAYWRRGFAMGQSHELDAVLKLYVESYYGGTGGIDARSLYVFVEQLRRLEHRS